MWRVRKLSALRREDARDGDCNDMLVMAAHSLSLSSHLRIHIISSSLYISLLPNDDTDCPRPRFPDAVPTSVPVSASTPTSIALQPGAFVLFPLSFALRFVVSLWALSRASCAGAVVLGAILCPPPFSCRAVPPPSPCPLPHPRLALAKSSPL
jgi:hypothetical protein